MISPKLSKRLSTVTQYIRGGNILADIGTDHAYLPIYAVKEGLVSYAIATDINEGPLERAKGNIVENGLQEKIKTILTNGLDGVEIYKPDYITICGMGGELIVEILRASEYVRNTDVKLILQPMTSIEELRDYLSSGYDILDEYVVNEDKKFYQIICVQYTGKGRTISGLEREVGKGLFRKDNPDSKLYLDFLINKYRKIVISKRNSSYDVSFEENRIKELEKYYEIY